MDTERPLILKLRKSQPVIISQRYRYKTASERTVGLLQQATLPTTKMADLAPAIKMADPARQAPARPRPPPAPTPPGRGARGGAAFATS